MVRRISTLVAALGVMVVFVVGAGAHETIGNCGADTHSATNVTSTSATLNGLIGDADLEADASNCGTWFFDYGTTPEYGPTTPSMPAGTGPNVPVSASVTGLTPDTTYHFRVHASTGGMNIGDDFSFQTDPAPPPPPPQTAALSISNSANPSTVPNRSNVTLTVVVTNAGPADATDVTVRDALPSTLNLVSASSTRGACTGTTTVTCSIGSLGNGAAATVSIVVNVTGSGSIPDTATVDGSNLDASSNTSATATITVTAPPPPATTTTTTTTTTSPEPSPAPGPANVVVDDSIDGISIGETEQEVEQKLGAPDSTLTLAFPDGKKGKLGRYHSHGGLFLVTYDSNGHVVSLETYSTFFRTSDGLGPGSSLMKVAGLHGFRTDYCELGYWNGTSHSKPGSVVTVFTPDGGIVASVLITELRLYTDCATGSTELAPTATLTLGHSIGGVSIGMGEQAVTAALGPPASTLRITLGGGKTGRSVRYRAHGAPLLITYDSTGKVVSIESYSPFFKTIGGIGPGASLSLVRALRGFGPDYCELGYWNGTRHTRPTAVVTVFTPSGGIVASVLITELRLYTACATGSTELPPST